MYMGQLSKLPTDDFMIKNNKNKGRTSAEVTQWLEGQQRRQRHFKEDPVGQDEKIMSIAN